MERTTLIAATMSTLVLACAPAIAAAAMTSTEAVDPTAPPIEATLVYPVDCAEDSCVVEANPEPQTELAAQESSCLNQISDTEPYPDTCALYDGGTTPVTTKETVYGGGARRTPLRGNRPSHAAIRARPVHRQTSRAHAARPVHRQTSRARAATTPQTRFSAKRLQLTSSHATSPSTRTSNHTPVAPVLAALAAILALVSWRVSVRQSQHSQQ